MSATPTITSNAGALPPYSSQRFGHDGDVLLAQAGGKSPAQARIDKIETLMESSFTNPVTYGDVKEAIGLITSAPPAEASTVVKGLATSGTLNTLVREMNDGTAFNLGGLTHDEKRETFASLAKSLDAEALAAFSDALAKDKGRLEPDTSSQPKGLDLWARTDVEALGAAVATHADANTKVDFAKRLLPSTTDQTTSPTITGLLEGRLADNSDPEARSVALVLMSLDTAPAAANEVFGALAGNEKQLDAVANAAFDPRTLTVNGHDVKGYTPQDAEAFAKAASQVSDPELKARIITSFAKPLEAISPTPANEATIAAAAKGITQIIASDPTRVMQQMTYDGASERGAPFITYAKAMMRTDQSEDLAALGVALSTGNGSAKPADFMEQTVDLGGGKQRWENAQAMGYFAGSVYQAAAQLGDEFASGEKSATQNLTILLKSALVVIDKNKYGGFYGNLAASLSKELVKVSVGAALDAMSSAPANPAREFDKAFIPLDPQTNDKTLSTSAEAAYNNGIQQVGGKALLE